MNRRISEVSFLFLAGPLVADSIHHKVNELLNVFLHKIISLFFNISSFTKHVILFLIFNYEC